jgi:uncharacterized protein (TIGR02611 family)
MCGRTGFVPLDGRGLGLERLRARATVLGLEKVWQRLRQAAPGERFLGLYQEHERKRRNRWAKPLWFTIGALITVVGLVALPAPGPGMLVVALGLAILARESERVARAVDWLELRIRSMAKRGKAAWNRASLLGKVAVVGLLAGIIALVAVGATRFLTA